VTLVQFTDGTSRDVRDNLAPQIVGLDEAGDLLVHGLGEEPIAASDGVGDYLTPLTPCCYASGKGSIDSSTGICCRTCYRDVDNKYGGSSHLAVPVTTLPEDVDIRNRLVPTDQQMRIAAAMLTVASPEVTHVLVGLALPGKQQSWWKTGQPVEPAPGFFLAIDGTDWSVPLHYSSARELAYRAARYRLAGREGCTGCVNINRRGHFAAFMD
jgi:hypothetical protein